MKDCIKLGLTFQFETWTRPKSSRFKIKIQTKFLYSLSYTTGFNITPSQIMFNFLRLRMLLWSVLLTQYCAGNKIEKNEMGWACGAYGWGEGGYRVLVGKPEGRRPLGRPRRRWVDNNRMNLQEVGCGYMDWIGLAQDRDRWRTLLIAVMNLRFPWNAGNFLTSCKPVSFSRRTLHHGVSK